MNKQMLSPTNNSSPVSDEPDRTLSGTNSADELYGIDAAKGIRTLNNNAKIYAKLLKTFSVNTMYDEFIEAVNNADMEQAAAKAHALKGVSANLHINLVYEIMSVLETAAKSGEVISPEDSRVTQLKEAYTKTMKTVEAVIAAPEILEKYKK